MRTSEGPCFFVKVDHGGVAAFKKAMENFDVEISSYRQINRKEFLVTFKELSTTIFDAKDFYPIALWSQVA